MDYAARFKRISRSLDELFTESRKNVTTDLKALGARVFWPMLPYVDHAEIRSMPPRIRSRAYLAAEGNARLLWGLPFLLLCPLFRTVGETRKNISGSLLTFFYGVLYLLHGSGNYAPHEKAG